MRIFDGKTYRDMTEEEMAAMQEEAEKAEAVERHRPMTEAEVASLLIRQQINTISVDDNTAIRMKGFYPNFTDIIGQTVKQGFKFTYGDKLFKTIQAELTISEHYVPGTGTESLYAKICEAYDGSRYDPIPYSGNMSLEKGKYYTQEGVTYLCIRDTGNPVYHRLAELTGVYVERV